MMIVKQVAITFVILGGTLQYMIILVIHMVIIITILKAFAEF